MFNVWLGLNTLLKSICSRHTQKSNLHKFFLQNYRQLNSNFHETELYQRENLRESIIAYQRENLRENIITKVSSYSYWKEKTSWMFSQICNLLKIEASSDHFLETFLKYQLKTTVIADRIDQKRNWLMHLFLNTV